MDEKKIRKIVRDEIRRQKENDWFYQNTVTDVLGRDKDGTLILGKTRKMKKA